LSHTFGGHFVTAEDLDIKRDSDLPSLTRIDWRLAGPMNAGRLLSGAVS
jgi:hypothetical protein